MRADFARQIKTIRRFFFFLSHCFFAKINLGISAFRELSLWWLFSYRLPS